MEKKYFYEIFTVKNVLLYVLKVLILFVIMYFSFTTAFVLVFLLGFTIPIYAALIIGIAYFLSKFPKSENTEGQSFFRKHILKPLMLLIGVGVLFLGVVVANIVRDKLEIVELHVFLDNAEEIIEYNTHNFYVGGIMETEYEHELIIIDYDTMTVGFLHHPYVSAELTKIRLKDKKQIQSDKIQCEYILSSPGAKFTSFYPEDNSKHRTTAIEIEMENGNVYSADGLVDDAGHTLFLGLR